LPLFVYDYDHILNRADVRQRVPLKHDQVGFQAGLDRAGAFIDTNASRRHRGCGFDLPPTQSYFGIADES